MSTDAVSSSARGAGFLILLQISSRALTFALNQLLLRFLSPTLLGASVQLELFVISAHHFARESLRVACQRQPEGGIQAAINLSYLAIAGGIPIVLALAQWYLTTSLPDVPYFVESLRIYQIAAVIELLSEPAFVAVQQNMLYKSRAAAEASAVVLKTLATAGTVFWSQHQQLELGVLPFAAGELAYCSTLTLVYLWQTIPVATNQHFSLLPKSIKSSTANANAFLLSLFPTSLVNLSLSLYLQQGIKYLLTEGDVIVSTTLASLEDQGMYALSANYGGLIARMVFRPIEDASRNLFAKLCGDAKVDKMNSANTTNNKKNTDNMKQAHQSLQLILRAYSILSVICFAIGPAAAPLLLRLVAGARWSSSGAGEVLGIYSICIPLLAINGVSEAFVSATASTQELRNQSIWMGCFSLGFAGSAYLFLRVLNLGAKGLVLANCVNMGMRILFNLSFITSFFAKQGVRFGMVDLLPNSFVVAAAVVMPSLIGRMQGLFEAYGLLGDLLRVGGIGGAFALVVLVSEKDFLRDCWRRVRS